jgi:PPOX class probable F420-dependent enzyme
MTNRRGVFKMNQEEIAEFLSESRIAVMATINRDGTPQLTPNWYHYDGSVLTFVTTKERLKYINLSRDNRISVCIYAAPMASDYVVIKGTTTFNDQDMWDEARRIMARYVPEDEIDEHLEMWKTQPRVLVTVTPTRISSRRR